MLRHEERYRALIDLAPDGIFITDANGKYGEVNSSGCTMLGYGHEELLTRSITDLFAPDDAAPDPVRWNELRQGTPIISEHMLIRKDGTLLPVEISSRMLPDGRFQSIVRDISERKRSEEIARNFTADLEERVSGLRNWNRPTKNWKHSATRFRMTCAHAARN